MERDYQLSFVNRHGPETWHSEVQNTKRVWDGNVAVPPRPSSDSSFQAPLVGVSASDLAAEWQAVNMGDPIDSLQFSCHFNAPEVGPTNPRIPRKIELGHAQPGSSRPHRRHRWCAAYAGAECMGVPELKGITSFLPFQHISNTRVPARFCCRQ